MFCHGSKVLGSVARAHYPAAMYKMTTLAVQAMSSSVARHHARQHVRPTIRDVDRIASDRTSAWVPLTLQFQGMTVRCITLLRPQALHAPNIINNNNNEFCFV